MNRALNPAPEIDLHIIGEYSGSESYDEDALDPTNIPTGTAQPDLEPDDTDFPVFDSHSQLSCPIANTKY